jgi:hypothetical protein
VQRYPVVHGGMSTHLTVYKKFIDANRCGANPRGEVGIDIGQLRKRIVNAVKAAQNGLRQHDDLKMELGFDKQRRAHVIFATTVRKLEAQGYVKRVVVCKTGKREEHFRCIKFIQDLPDDDDKNDASDISDDDMFDEISEELDKSTEPVSSSAAGKTDTTADFDASDMIKIEEDGFQAINHQHVLFNLFYPLENQIYDAVSAGGVQGLPAMDLCRRIVGVNYSRNFSRVLDFLVDRPTGKSGNKGRKVRAREVPPSLVYLVLVRGIDFSARMKFYRYFTQVSYSAYADKLPDEQWGAFQKLDLAGASKSLAVLDTKCYSALPGLAEVRQDENRNFIPLFFGDKGKVSSESVVVVSAPRPEAVSTGKKRGRPRKRPLDEREAAKANGSFSTAALSDAAATPTQKRARKSGGAKMSKEPPKETVDDVNEAKRTAQALEIVTPQIKDDIAADVVSSAIDVTGPLMNVEAATTNVLVSSEVMTPVIPAPPIEPALVGVEAPAASERIEASEPARQAAGYDSVNRELRLPRPESLSFAAQKRQSQILSLLEANDGMLEGGVSLVKLLVQMYAHKDGSSIDRKTVERSVSALVESRKVNQIHVTIPSVRGIHITKYIILSLDIDPSSSEVEELKRKVIEGIKRKPGLPLNEPEQVSIEENDFRYYFKNKASPMSNAAKRLARETLKQSERQPSAKRIKTEPSKPVALVPKRDPTVAKFASTSLYRPAAHGMPSTGVISSFSTHTIPTKITRKGVVRELDTQETKERRRRSRRAGYVDADKFYRVVVITRSIFSSSQGIINWDKVTEALPGLSSEFAKAKWPKIRDMYGGVKQLGPATQLWESLFLKSYESGELPTVENDNYDIAFYADFWKAHEQHLNESGVPWLYANRADFEAEYRLCGLEEVVEPLEAVYGPISMVKTDEIMVNTPFGYSIKDDLPQATRPELTAAKQAIKAIIATEKAPYDPDMAREVLVQVTDTLKAAVSELEAEKAIVYVPRDKEKVMPGRNYIFSDKLTSVLQLRIGDDVFDRATAFENDLVSTIRSSKGMIMSRFAKDSSLISILDFICYRMVDLVRVNMTKGKLIVGYRSRAIDKDKLDFDIVLRNQQGSEEMTEMHRPDVPLPLGEPCGNVWTNTQGELNKDIWLKVVRNILMMVALRPGITAAVIYRKMAILLTYEEVFQVLAWLCLRGCLRNGDCGGYWIEPRWYSNIM